jgi:Holliday junction DNA helicase RuvA
MYAFLEGEFIFKSPANVLVNVNGVGYDVQISLSTYDRIHNLQKGRLLTYLRVSEDAHTLYGFHDEVERTLFLHLLSVSGVGASTARMMLSGMGPSELAQAIVNGEEKILQAIKGIGAKTAQRIILELKTKLSKQEILTSNLTGTNQTKSSTDALNALISLGISKNSAQEALKKALAQDPLLEDTQELIKLALKNI